ncbi:hypothetical protein PaG_03283 [Moesziomyces aphidis]|jgi:hypothetical protein|uniref:Uncharacterized protein n=1 Tax=Moesziomyces aphidis TaxID=84754 RepID=W3VM46_MOEAP|nr:hypothetical protein PaG_03283 [Moesziomyces aphidis]
MTIDQYQQAIAGAGAGAGAVAGAGGLQRRDLYSYDMGSLLIDNVLHKRQDATEPAKAPAKVLMCINGDPDVPAIKFNTMTELRIRDASAQQDGVMQVTNLPNYQTPWMPFLPTADMWAEQQTLMIEQEKIIETNMTTAPPPSS